MAQDRLRTALQGVRGLVLDADGVIVLKGEPLPGSVDAIRSLQDRKIPFRVVTNFSQMHRETLARWMGKSGLAIDPGLIITGTSATAAHTAAVHAGRCWCWPPRMRAASSRASGS
jgi:ribonucleotide monophosphatase NagD (HAD superfamily)